MEFLVNEMQLGQVSLPDTSVLLSVVILPLPQVAVPNDLI
jgi:hypothetical protein